MIVNFIDPRAAIAKSVKVWHFAVVHNCVIMPGCSIGSRAEICNYVAIGENSRISSGAFIAPGTFIGKGVFIGPNVTFTDDRHPRAGNVNYKREPAMVLDGASIGAGSVILPGVTIGRNAMIGAGSVVAQDVPDNAILRGERASIQRIP